MKFNLKFNFHDILMSLFSVIIVMLMVVISVIATPKSSSDDFAVVRYNNKIVKRMPLDKDDDFIMRKEDGYIDLYGDELIVSVRNYKVKISKEDSPFHYCSYLGEISKKGSSLICVPNCVRVTIESYEDSPNNSNPDVDIIPGV